MVRESVVDSTVDLSDGRAVAYADFGPADAVPLLYVHGNPGCRLDLARDDLLAPLQEAGYRPIGFDRPGFGCSPFVAGRTHADWAVDLGWVADRLGLERLVLLAFSRGAMFGLACAVRFPDRLAGICLLSPVAPGEMPGWRRSWRPDMRLSLAINRRVPALARATIRAGSLAMRTEAGAVRAFSAYMRSPADTRAIRAHPDHTLRVASEINRQGPAALVEDARRQVNWPLGFHLEQVELPVPILHGDADRLCPISHPRFLAERLPDAALHIQPDYGHVPTGASLTRVTELLGSRHAVL